MNDLTYIYASRQSNKILTGTISGIQKNNKVKCAVVFNESVKVIIPQSEMGIKDYVNIRSMVGAEIDYAVEQFDQANNIAVASRAKAMELRRHLELSHHNPGDEILARVVTVGKNALYAEVYGVETKVPRENAAWGSVGDLRYTFTSGNKVPAVIKTIDPDASTVEISIKEAKDNPFSKSFKKYMAKCEYAATVTGVKEDGIFES